MTRPSRHQLLHARTEADGRPAVAHTDPDLDYPAPCPTVGHHARDPWLRGARFNRQTGVITGGNKHPDRCQCQGADRTPHKHYSASDPAHGCARCGPCKAYWPAESESPSGDNVDQTPNRKDT